MERNEIKDILETLFFITDTPVSIDKLKEIFAGNSSVTEELLKDLVNELVQEYSTRPVDLREVAGGYQFSTRPHFSQYVRKLFKERTTLRISTSALETLSIIAYKQPITRAEIDDIRGVEVTNVLETIRERKLVKIVGRKETVGRPLLYGTTTDFMRYFGLKNLNDLPSLEELNIGQAHDPTLGERLQSEEGEGEQTTEQTETNEQSEGGGNT
ncbi:MAG: SMC-Scp complex subunit ScpB [Elusimicrobiota bacterium]